MLYIVGGQESLSHILRIMGRGGGGMLYIVGGQGSLSHFLRTKIIDPAFLGVSWERKRCVTNWVLFRGNLSL